MEIGTPERAVVTTCAYCGVGCTFRAEMRGEQVVRMVPWKDGKANRGHSCVKGRFAWGYASHRERILEPMIRDSIDEPWREVSWDEAIAHTASEFRRIQAQYGARTRRRHHLAPLHQRGDLPRPEAGPRRASATTMSIPARASAIRRPATASRPPSAPRPAPRISTASMQADVIVVIGANPDRRPSGVRLADEAAAAPGREADRHRSAPDRPGPHAAYRGEHHLPLQPGTNVAVLTAMAHVDRHRGAGRRGLHPRALRLGRISGLGGVRRPSPSTRPRRWRPLTGVPAADLRARGAALRDRRQRRDLLRARRHRAQPGLDRR